MTQTQILVTSANGHTGGHIQSKRFKRIYEGLRQLIIWLGLIEMAWMTYWLMGLQDPTPGYMTTVGIWIGAMFAWGALVIYLGQKEFFLKHTRWLSNLIGNVAVVGFAVLLFGTAETVRQGVLSTAAGVSDLQLISFHVLRLTAIGAFIKYRQGQLPLHFIIVGALPDLLFAISALGLTIFAGNGAMGRELLIAWHLIGFSLFLGAGISMFFTVPSPFRISRRQLDTSIVFRYPMVLAPNFTVPLFMLAHVYALAKLLLS